MICLWLEVLIAALGRLGTGAPCCWSLASQLVGVDFEAPALRAGLGPQQVRQLGRVADADLAVVLRRASLLVVRSRAEGFGRPTPRR